MNSQILKLNKLEAIRGFAAIYVVLQHYFTSNVLVLGHDISAVFKFGQESVILFFLLSGFVIQYSYLRSSDKTIRTFLIKRTLRIYFPLIIVLVVHTFLSYVYTSGITKNDLWQLMGNVLMLQDIASLKPGVLFEPYLGNLPLWSLSYEWWFYIIFCIASIKLQWSSNRVYLCGLVAALAYLYFPNFLIRQLIYLVIWWVGTDLAKIYFTTGTIKFINIKSPLIALIFIILVLILNVFMHTGSTHLGASPYLELRHFVFALIVVVLGLTWKKLNWIGFKYTLQVFEYIAPISFVLYISHWMLLIDAHYLDKFDFSYNLKFGLYFITCIVFSYIVELIIYPRFYKNIFKRLNK